MTAKTLLTIDESSLPKGWKGLTLADVTGYIQRGKGPKYIERSDLPVINQKCIRWFGIQKEHLKYVDPEQWSAWGEERYVRVGDVLWNSTGTGTIGRAALVKNLMAGEKYVVDSHVTIVRPRDIDPEYVHYWIMSPAVQGSIESMQSGSTNQVELSKSAVEALPIPVAPPEQQKTIVAEIEKQFSRLDEATANLRRVKANLKRYKAAILKAAVEGKLTEDWRKQHPDVEPASKLLERILVERREKWSGKGKYVEPSAPETTDLPSLPQAWTWATVEQLSLLVQYGSSSKTDEEAIGVPVLRMGNIEDGRLRFDSLKYLPKNHDEFPGLFLQEGDILFNRTNSAELVGKTAVYKGMPDPCSFASYLIRVRLVQGCAPDFLAYFINSVFGRAWIAQVVSQQVGQANVNGTKLQALAVPLPPLIEQRQIVAEVERRLSVIEELEAAVQANLIRANRLRQSTLTAAFSGRLL